MNDERDLSQHLVRATGPLAPPPTVRTRLLASIEHAPQAEAVRAQRPWWALSLAAAALAGLGLWLAARERGTTPPQPPETTLGRSGLEDWEERPEVTAERKENEACWEREREALRKDHKGEWVLIAHGKVRLLDSTRTEPPESLLKHGALYPVRHAFAYRVGEDGPRALDFFSTWYSPRFAGAALASVLDAEWSMGGTRAALSKEGKPTQRGEGPVFPRFHLDLEGPPILNEPRGARLERQEVFLGTLGPPLMLTPQDAVMLDLGRWEVPGLVTFWGGRRCRQVMLRVGVSGWDEPHWVTATWPIEPHEWLVGQSRARDAFWAWGGDLGDQAIAASPIRPGSDMTWVLFGRDRVLARASGPLGGLLGLHHGDAEPTYHRYLMRWPREGPLAFAPEAFGSPEREERLNGRPTRVRGALKPDPSAEPGPFLVSAADAAALHLEGAEEGRDLSWAQAQGEALPLRGGYTWFGDSPPPGNLGGWSQRKDRAVLVVYLPAAPPPEPPAPPSMPERAPPR